MGGMSGARFWRYQTLLMVLLSLNFGVVFFDRNAMSYLGPLVQKDLRLDNGQIGLIASGFSIAWGLSGFLGGALVDRFGRRKLFLVIATLAFSVCSLASGLAVSFAVLIAARVVMGAVEGPMNPVQQSFAAAEASPESRGLSMGFVQNFGSNLIGSGLAPIVIAALAAAFGWRSAFFAAAAPGLLMALLILLIVREPKAERGQGAAGVEPRLPLRAMLGQRNVWLCMLISVCMVPWMVLGWTFLPLLYANVRHIAPGPASWLMAVLGVSAALGAFVLPGLSDRFGRKPVMILGSVLGASVPLAALYFGGSLWILGALIFVGWLASGVFPLFMATIPCETLGGRNAATSTGLTQGLGEILGAGVGATLAGKAADAFGLPAAMWIMAGCAVAGGLLSLFLRETAPARTSPKTNGAGAADAPAPKAA